jgi:hypothetical protein
MIEKILKRKATIVLQIYQITELIFSSKEDKNGLSIQCQLIFIISNPAIMSSAEM